MQALAFWKAVTMDRANFLEELVGLLADHEVCYCVVGGQAVNAYVEPLVSLDLDLVIAVEQLEMVEKLLQSRFRVESFPHNVNISSPDSNLRVQIQRDPRYFQFVERAGHREVLGLRLPVAAIEDVLQGKVWAAMDAERRPTKRRKDLLDIERLLESYPHLHVRVPAEIIARLSQS